MARQPNQSPMPVTEAIRPDKIKLTATSADDPDDAHVYPYFAFSVVTAAS